MLISCAELYFEELAVCALVSQANCVFCRTRVLSLIAKNGVSIEPVIGNHILLRDTFAGTRDACSCFCRGIIVLGLTNLLITKKPKGIDFTRLSANINKFKLKL